MIKRLATCIAVAISLHFSVHAQTDYSNYSQQNTRINNLAKNSLAKVTSIAKTAGGKDVWMITIGTGNTTSKPAIAVVGGVEGNHLLGTEMAIGCAESLLASSQADSIKRLWDKSTF